MTPTRVLALHGVRNFKAADTSPGEGAARLRTEWLDALTGSRSNLDLQVAYYADLLRSDRQGGAQLTEPEQEFVTAWAQAWNINTADAQGRATGWLRWLCGKVAERSAQRPEFVEQAIRRFAPEVTRYLTTPARIRVRDRVIRRLTAHRPSIVVAHSLGSVVAYEALHHAPDAKVDLFLTLGSPLALPGAIFDRLDPAPIAGRGTRPPNVARWVNVADRGDVIAIPRGALARSFDGVEQLPDISIAPISPHGVLDYLRHPAVRDVIAEHS